MNIMSRLKKHYWAPTPKKWRQIGDVLLAISTFITTGGLIAFDELKSIYTPKEIRILITVIIVCGVLGKFLTNFFKEDEKEG